MHPTALFDHHVFVDLETTGLDPSTDEVIEFGALFIEGGQIVSRVSRLFSSSRPLPEVICRITGLGDHQLQGLPRFTQAAHELGPLLSGWTLVAHNAGFEKSFLAGAIIDPSLRLVDSCELLHYLFPELESHSLEAAIRWARVGEVAAHRALRDCEDTFAVLSHAFARVIAEGRAQDVVDLVQCLSSPHDSHPMVDLLVALSTCCAQAERGLADPTGNALANKSYEERAAHAYLRALERRALPQSRRISTWFQEHFPAVAAVSAQAS